MSSESSKIIVGKTRRVCKFVSWDGVSTRRVEAGLSLAAAQWARLTVVETAQWAGQEAVKPAPSAQLNAQGTE
jgi:hypothetical protein